MSYAAKGYNKILLMRLRDGLESKLRYNQNGFCPDRSTLQHVLALRRLFEVARISDLSAQSSIFAKLSTL